MKSGHAIRVAVLLGLVMGSGWSTDQAIAGIINGDFSHATPLFGYSPTGGTISEPNDEFAQLSTNGTPSRVLTQTFTVPAVPSVLSIDFAFSTEATATPVFPLFPDAFGVSLKTIDGDFLDLLVVDVTSVIVDPTDGFEGIVGTTPINVSLDQALISGFSGFVGGTGWSGRISLSLPANVLGDVSTIRFELLDKDTGYASIAAVDNISLTSIDPVPEPNSLACWALMLSTTLIRRRTPKARA